MSDKTVQNSSSKASRMTNNLVLLVALVAGLIAVILLSSVLSSRHDLTTQHVNSLSPESQKAVQALFDETQLDELVATVYISDQLPETIQEGPGQNVDLRNVDQKLLDKLEEYRAVSDGRLRIVVEHVTDDEVDTVIENYDLAPLVSEEASAKVKDGKLSIRRQVLGLTLNAGKVQEVLPKAIQPGLFEYELTRRITRIHDRIRHDSEIERFRLASDELDKAIQVCDKEMHRFEKVEEATKDEQFGIQGLLAPITSVQDEIVAMAKSLDDIKLRCDPIVGLLTQYKNSLGGLNKRFDAILSGNATEGQIGGVAAYVALATTLQSVVVDPKANPQQFTDLKGQLKAVKDDIANLKKELEGSAGERRIGVVCGHGEFCPFNSEKLPLDPKMAQLMGGQNQIQQHLFNIALQIQDIVNRFQSSAGMVLGREHNFALEKLDAGKPIPETYSAVVLIGPKSSLSDRERYELDQYLMRGGTLMIFAENYNVSLQGFAQADLEKAGMQAIQLFMAIGQGASVVGKYNAVAKTPSNINDLLSKYGITVNSDLIVDDKNSNQVTTFDTATMNDGRQVGGMAPLPYGLLPVAKDFDRANVAVSGFHKLTLPFASSITVTPVEGQDVQVSNLIQSSADAIAFPTPDLLAPGEEATADAPATPAAPALKVLPPELKEQVASMQPNGPHTLAVLVTGTFKSAFDETKIPSPPAPEAEGATPPLKFPHAASGNGRILVVGSTLGLPPVSIESIFQGVDMASIQGGDIHTLIGRFMNFVTRLRQLSRVYPETFPALFNFFDWAAQRTALAEIRAKNIAFRPLDSLEESTKTTVEIAAIGGLPLAFLLLAGLGWMLRTRSRRKRVAALAANAPKPTPAP